MPIQCEFNLNLNLTIGYKHSKRPTFVCTCFC